MSAGKFITFEGGEGSGKSTQARRLADFLRSMGCETILTREPGGTPFAEQVRNLILSGATARHGPTAEALLFFAARSDHVEALIRPALSRGAWVICDRFSDSTRVYQGAAGTMPLEDIETLDRIVVGYSRPDLTLILDMDPTLGLTRATERRTARDQQTTAPDPYEQRGLDFHRRLRDGYLQIAQANPMRCRVIDAGGTPDAVEERVRKAVLEQFAPDLSGKVP
jgi:dTMP kinase